MNVTPGKHKHIYTPSYLDEARNAIVEAQQTFTFLTESAEQNEHSEGVDHHSLDAERTGRTAARTNWDLTATPVWDAGWTERPHRLRP